MASFTDVFGGQTVPPSEPSLTRIDLAADGALAWPDNFSGTVVDEHLASSIVEVSLSSPFVLSLPPADRASVGTDILIRNVGSAQLSVIDAEGGAVTTVDPGESKYFYVQVNLTAAGIWQVFTYGTGTSGADASLLAGMGLQADTGNKLQLYVEYRSVNSDMDIVVEDRAKIVEIVAGSVTVTLPQASEAGNGFSVMLRNSSDGSVVIEGFGSEQVDGALNKTLFPGESCVLVCNGTYWISVGYGRDAEFMFSEVVVDASLSNITLTSSEVAGRMIRVAGVATGNVTITLPTVDNIYFVSVDSGVGGFQVELKTSLPGSSVSLAANQSTILYCDGSNVGIAINTALVSTLNLADGSAAVPSIRYSLDVDTGLFRSGAGQVSFSSNGVATAGFNGSGLFSTTAATADSTTKAATTAFVQDNFTGRSVTAGDGLTGGGTLATSRTLTLGTPSTLTTGTANAVTTNSHTHAVTFPVTSVAGKTGAVLLAKGDVGLGNVTNDAQLKIASNLSDLNNAATARTNLGLGTAVTADVTTSTTDTTAGRLLKVGDFGIGTPALTLLSNSGDWNTATIGGANYMGFNCVNAPLPNLWFIGVTHRHDPSYQVQELNTFTAALPRKFVRNNAAGVWGSWVEFYHAGNTGTAVTADVTTSVTDTTAGRLLKVGDFGWGASPGGVPLAFDSAEYAGTYYMDSPGGGLPNGRYVVFVSRVTPSSASGEVIQLAVSTASRQFVRRRVSGAWQPWVEVYTQNSILGTVSQSAGVPTGAIIERGNNANGTYIRFADGTQICMVQFSGTIAVTTASGSSFVSTDYTWTFPAAFASDYISVSGCVVGTGACTLRQSTTLATTSLAYKLHSSVSGTFNAPRILAIGRWF